MWCCLPNTLAADQKAMSSFSDSSGKRTRLPPHLVSAGEVLWKEPRLAEGRALDAELTHPDVTRSRPKPIPPERQNADPRPGYLAHWGFTFMITSVMSS